MLQICTTECNPFGSMLSNVSQYFSDGVRLPKRRGTWLESRWDSLKCFNLRAHKHNLLTVHALSARFYFWSSYTHSDHFSLWRWNYLWRYFRKHWKLISSSSSSPLPSSSQTLWTCESVLFETIIWLDFQEWQPFLCYYDDAPHVLKYVDTMGINLLL